MRKIQLSSNCSLEILRFDLHDRKWTAVNRLVVMSQHITAASAGTSVRSLSYHFLLVNYGTSAGCLAVKYSCCYGCSALQKLLGDVDAANGGTTRLQIAVHLVCSGRVPRKLPSFPQKSSGTLRTGLLLILSQHAPLRAAGGAGSDTWRMVDTQRCINANWWCVTAGGSAPRTASN